MTNPYNTPKSDIEVNNVQRSVSAGKLIASVALMIISGLIYVGIFLAIPHFEEMLEAFGADLPTITIFVFESYQFYGLLYLVGLLPFVKLLLDIYKPGKHEKILFVLIVSNFIISLAVMIFVMICVYLPIFSMGQVV